jgi:hypothetical protein
LRATFLPAPIRNLAIIGWPDHADLSPTARKMTLFPEPDSPSSPRAGARRAVTRETDVEAADVDARSYGSCGTLS